jgi:hypothetical protein
MTMLPWIVSPPPDRRPMLDDLLPVGYAAVCAMVSMPLAIASRRLGYDADFSGVQKLHSVPTSRLGGFNVSAAYARVTMLTFRDELLALATSLMLVVAALPVIAVCAWDPPTRRVRPWHRLAGVAASGAPAS